MLFKHLFLGLLFCMTQMSHSSIAYYSIGVGHVPCHDHSAGEAPTGLLDSFLGLGTQYLTPGHTETLINGLVRIPYIESSLNLNQIKQMEVKGIIELIGKKQFARVNHASFFVNTGFVLPMMLISNKMFGCHPGFVVGGGMHYPVHPQLVFNIAGNGFVDANLDIKPVITAKLDFKRG